ncbi:YeiH family protein [Tessaracoccus aquimaris]|nr:putative sulfate exporter family transporter [Tessaracoccus aquimaris]
MPTHLLPGLALAASAVVVSWFMSRLGVSALLVAIVLGVIVGNAVRLPASLEPGIAFASKRLLRAGIVVLGLQLTLGDIWALGPGMIAVVIAVVTIGILSTLWIGRRLGVSPTQTLLIACGFSICGAAAVAAIDGVIDADDDEVVTAVGLVVAFGTAMIGLVPLLAGLVGLSPAQTGLWAGASIHEVAQVVAVGGSLGAAALSAAVIVKLARVLLLAPVMAVISVRRRRQGSTTGKRPPIIPLFVAGFLAMVILRSVGLVPDVVVGAASTVQTVLLSAAMFALGTGARFAAFRKLGAGPFVLAAISTVIVGAVGLTGTLLVGA